MITSITVRERASYEEVGELLKERLDDLNDKGFKIISVHETKVNGGLGSSNQGFIIIYDTNEESK